MFDHFRGLVLALLFVPAIGLAEGEEIFNYREIDATLSTSGQVADEQVPQLTEEDFGSS